MTIEEAKQALSRVVECSERAGKCLPGNCLQCKLRVDLTEEIAAIKVALGCIGMVQEVIGFSGTEEQK